jgi:hypothetical protein
MSETALSNDERVRGDEEVPSLTRMKKTSSRLKRRRPATIRRKVPLRRWQNENQEKPISKRQTVTEAIEDKYPEGVPYIQNKRRILEVSGLLELDSNRL